MRFEWDARKERQNLTKHGVSFEEAKALFTSGVDYLEIYDSAHSGEEERLIAVGPIRRGLVLVVFTERTEDAIRIISAHGRPRQSKRSTSSTRRRTDEEPEPQ